jgi:hypothetical protein
LKTSLTSLLCILCAFGADAALRTGNSGTGRGGTYSAAQAGGYYDDASRAPTQQEIIATAQNSTELGLPVRVADMNLARMIAARNPDAGVDVTELDSCAAIYPGGSFAWDTANMGFGGATRGCVADVEMRLVNGADDVVLARARVAAGSAFECNISAFPADGYTMDAGNITFPADNPPTMEDVKKVMDAEQKQNAGLRIAAATIVGGLGGNFIGTNDPGKSGMLGGSRDKIQKTALGALTLGGLTAVSTQAGKVGGDTIMGATVNAIGGGLVGNISGIGDAVLLTRKCDSGQDCLYGVLSKNELVNFSKQQAFYTISGGSAQICDVPEPSENGEFMHCSGANLVSYEINSTPKLNQDSKPEEVKRVLESRTERFCLLNGIMKQADSAGCNGAEIYYKLDKAQRTIGAGEPAVIVGYTGKGKYDDWRQWKAQNKNIDIRLRYSDGTLGRRISDEYTVDNFQPLTESASDGAIIDINSRARLGATATGAGVGGAVGGLSSYQGARTDIENRWVAEVQAYKDSLTKIYCATGTRFLSQYNEMTLIPETR